MNTSARLKTVEECEIHRDQTTGIFETQLEEARYAAKRVFEQYNAVDARNRLVADESFRPDEDLILRSSPLYTASCKL